MPAPRARANAGGGAGFGPPFHIVGGRCPLAAGDRHRFLVLPDRRRRRGMVGAKLVSVRFNSIFGAIDPLDRVCNASARANAVVVRPARPVIPGHGSSAPISARWKSGRPLRSGRTGTSPAASRSISPAKPLGRQVLVVILADLSHGRVRAGPEALDLFPGELAVIGDRSCGSPRSSRGTPRSAPEPQSMQGVVPQTWNMRDEPTGCELEHEVEGRHLERADMGMPSMSATCSIAGRVSQPSCSCARHSSAMTRWPRAPPLGIL